MGDEVREHAGRVGDAHGGRTGSGFYEHCIVGTVEPAFDFNNIGLAGKAPGKPDRGHRRLGSARHEPYHVHARVIPVMSRANSGSSGTGVPYSQPFSSRATIAFFISGWAWPRRRGP